MLVQNDNLTESDWSKKAHDYPYSLLFSFYQLKRGSIVAPSESIKFPITWLLFGGFLGKRTEIGGVIVEDDDDDSSAVDWSAS